MCGIAGTFGAEWSDAHFAQLYGAIDHRGRDGAGDTARGALRLGMRRLRLRGADVALPLTTHKAIGAFNGQIYGVRRGGTALEPLRPGVLAEFEAAISANVEPDGMFAVASAPVDGSSIALATDREFIKPLFYRLSAHGLAFCSELNPLAQLAANELDRAALAELFCFGWYLGEQSYLADLRSVARHNVCATEHELRETPKPRPVPLPLPDPASALREAITASVMASVSGHGPFGLAVSGGLDSSILAFELNAAGVEDLTTFSVIGAEDGIASLAELGLPSGSWRTWRHRTITLDADAEFARRFREATLRFGQPTGMSSIVLMDLIAEAAAQEGVSVLLTGEGVDEYFCGYPEYTEVAPDEPGLAFYTKVARKRVATALLGAELVDDAETRFRSTYDHETDLRYIERDLRLARLLLRTDVALMARTIEGRVPFLHRRIPDIALAVPWAEMVRPPGKWLLRQAYANRLGPRARVSKRRFKVDDAVLLRQFSDRMVGAALRASLCPVFGRRAVEEALEILAHDDGFDPGVACLILSLAHLIDGGVLDGHLA